MPEDQAAILAKVQEKSRIIAIQQRKANAGEFKSYGGAIGLQRERLERQRLMALLSPPRLVYA
jgi:hypothetical protein